MRQQTNEKSTKKERKKITVTKIPQFPLDNFLLLLHNFPIKQKNSYIPTWCWWSRVLDLMFDKIIHVPVTELFILRLLSQTNSEMEYMEPDDWKITNKWLSLMVDIPLANADACMYALHIKTFTEHKHIHTSIGTS